MIKRVADSQESTRVLGRTRGQIKRLADSPALGSAFTRAALLPVTGVLQLLAARTAATSLGLDQYGLVTLLATLPGLLPFLDFGIGVRVTNTVAKESVGGRKLALAVPSIWAAGLRLLLIGFGVFALGWLLVITNLEKSLFDTDDPNLSSLCLVAAGCVALTIPLSLGGRILVGLGLNKRFMVLQSLGSVISFVLIMVVARVDVNVVLFTAAIMVGPVIGHAAATVSAIRAVGFGGFAEGFLAWRTAQFRSNSFAAGWSWAAFAIVLCDPLAFQSDRLFIQHLQGSVEVAHYSAVAQIYMPAFAVVSAGSIALWPALMREQSVSALRYRLKRNIVLLSTFGFFFAVVIASAGPFLASWILNVGTARSELVLLSLLFAALIWVHSIYACFGALFMRSNLIALQARWSVMMLVLNLMLAWPFTVWIGAGGPVLASVVSIVLCKLIPAACVFRRLSLDVSRHDLLLSHS